MMSRKSSGSCVDARLDSYDVKVSCEDSSMKHAILIRGDKALAEKAQSSVRLSTAIFMSLETKQQAIRS